jgi:hypothetical protein
VSGHQIGMSPQAIAGAFDLDHHGMVQEPVQQGGRDHGIPEHLTAFGEAPVRGEDHDALFRTGR